MIDMDYKEFSGAIKTGEATGRLAEAELSLRKRFTDTELMALINLMWFSEPMDSIRERLANLEKRSEAKS